MSFGSSPIAYELTSYSACIQEENMWCWAATVQGAMQFLLGRRCEQCELASKTFGLECCAKPLPRACNEAFNTGSALKAAGLWRETRRRPLTDTEVVMELRAARPIVAIIQNGRRVIRHAVTIVGVTGPSPWLVTLNDPEDGMVRGAALADVTANFRGYGKWIETHLLRGGVSFAPSEGNLIPGTAPDTGSATLSSVRIPMYVAEPEDLVERRLAENARLAAFEVLPDDGKGFIVEVPAEGGQGAQLDGPKAAAMLAYVPRYERRFGSRVRLLHVLGLFITAIWVSGEPDEADVVVPIYTLLREVAIGRVYAFEEFERSLDEAARAHVRATDRERDAERQVDRDQDRDDDRGPGGRGSGGRGR